MSHSLIATLISNPDAESTARIPNDLADKLSAELNGRKQSPNWLAEGIACDIALSSRMTQEQGQKILASILQGSKIDYAIQNADNRKKQALIADMDSTMIDQECIDELAAEIGVKEKVAAITAKAMNGEIEFESALRERVALLKGLPASVSQQVIEKRITLAKGGKTLVATMKQNTAWCALVSGGFTLFTQEIATMLGFDEHHANTLEIEDGAFSGTVREPILGAEAKVTALQTIARQKGLTAEDFIAVGDGANDLPMLTMAGTGIALHAKPSVAAQAKIRIDHGDLTALLYLQGYHQYEFARV